eukprot:COSAG01_NODE_757_length_13812_cov_11.540582_7_plen_208_part_00
MHNFSAPGAQTPVCSTGTSRPTPPWHCKTDGCVSTSNPETWLALDFSHQNITLPAACNSNKTWSGRCHYVDQPTGIAVQRKGSLLLVSHAYSSIPAIKIFAKRTGASRGILAPLAGRPSALALAADEDSVWTILRGEGGGGGIARYALNGVSTAAAAAAGAAQSPPSPTRPLATVSGIDTACELAVQPGTGELWVVERRSQVYMMPP